MSNKMAEMIGSDQFSKMLGSGVKILKYSDLEKYNEINQIIPESKGYRIMLIETKQSTGHWTTLIKYNPKSFEWFDSYGLAPDQEFSFISPEMQQILDEKRHILSILLNKLVSEGGSYTWNKMKLQQMKPGVNTCGRWVCGRVYFFQRGYDLKQFQQYFVNWKKQSGLSYDELVCEFTKNLD